MNEIFIIIHITNRSQIIWDELENVQNIFFPMNENDEIFIYPNELKNKLPSYAIDIIKPSQKYIPPFTIDKLRKFKMNITNNSNHKLYQYHLFPDIHTTTIQQILTSPLLTLKSDCKTEVKNHLLTQKTADTVIGYLLNDYKYGLPIQTHLIYKQNIHKQDPNLPIQFINCDVNILEKYEDKFNIKYVITDKSLGPGIIDRDLHTQISIKERDKILKPIKYKHNPAQIRDIATAFAHKFSHILHPKNHIPNQSLTDVLNDIHHTHNGYFQWNPLYKAHKFDDNNKHIPKIRPVISCNKSPLKPVLRIISDACIIIINVLQKQYNITNIIQDSFHAIYLIDEYIQNSYDINDNIITFDFVSFYTEIPIKFINEKLDFLKKLFTKYIYTKNGY